MLLLPLILAVSCGSVPEIQKLDQKAEEETEAVASLAPSLQDPSGVRIFDRGSISQERFEATKTEVQALIEDLNRIIRAKNYSVWTDYLAASYFEKINSETFLVEITEELYKRDQIVAANLGRDPKQVKKRVLKSARDYFSHVVVPSRSNDHVDDIDFVTEDRVKAYTLDLRGNRLVLYDLEIIDKKWKISS